MTEKRRRLWVAGIIWLLCSAVINSSCTSQQQEPTMIPPPGDPASRNDEEPRASQPLDADASPSSQHAAARSDDESRPDAQAESPDEAARFTVQRRQMVKEQLLGRDIRNESVLEAMGRVPRHRFVSDATRPLAYRDSPLPIGHGQTISQPYIVALMTQLVDPQPGSKALDIGTGSGYQAAILAEIVDSVYSIEIVEPLAEEARKRLESLGYANVHVRCGDGYRGWPEQAPFDIIVIAAAPDHVPRPLEEQLAPGGKMVIPVGAYFQDLLLIEKSRDGTLTRRSIAPVAFVPMTGEAEKK